MGATLIALTGATGFIGRGLLASLRQSGYRVRVLLRRPVDAMPDTDSAVIGDLVRPMNLSRALEDVDVVVHSAAIDPQMSGAPHDDFRAFNTVATVSLAAAAKRAGAKRFIFLSSVRAQAGHASEVILSEDLPPEPCDDYGRSKLAAEEGLADVGLEWAALRSALVYGPGVEGNMGALIKAACSRRVLPLPIPSGRRSLLALDNLSGAVCTLIETDQSLSRPFLVADDDPMTIAEIVATLRAGSGRSGVTVPVPSSAFRACASLFGLDRVAERLSGDLIVDTSRLKGLGWQPRVATREGLMKLGQA
ncbi:MAG: NAD-dependent epimerase/dehydratase family protein [Filomicrobium sp.]